MAFKVLDVLALIDVTANFVDKVFVRISCIWLVRWFSRFCFVCVYVGSLFHLVRLSVMTAIGLRRWHMRYAVYKDCVGNAVLV